MSKMSFWNGKKVFITGHTGFKGSWLCKILEKSGANITGYALEPLSQPNLFDLCKPNVSSVIGDILDFDLLLSVFNKVQPEIVIHLAAQPLVLDSYRKPRYTYNVNVMGTVNIMECVRQSDSVKSLLNVTTDKVYFNQERSEGYREDEQLNGYDPYSNSKSCSELVTSCYYNSFFKQKGISVSSVRSGNVIGGGDFSENRLIPDCARSLAAGEVIKIRNPDSIRPYSHVLDTLFAYLLVAQKQYENSTLSGAYNIGPSENDSVSNKELADLFCKAWGNGAKWECAHIDNPHESGLLKLDCSKIKRVLNQIPHWDIKQAVNETVAWYKAYFNNENTSAVMLGQIEEFMRFYAN